MRRNFTAMPERPKTVPTSFDLYGGRFESRPAEIMEEINASIEFDQKLFAHDIRASEVHAAMLVRQGIVSPEDGAAIQAGLSAVRDEIHAGRLAFSRKLEDIHMNV